MYIIYTQAANPFLERVNTHCALTKKKNVYASQAVQQQQWWSSELRPRRAVHVAYSEKVY